MSTVSRRCRPSNIRCCSRTTSARAVRCTGQLCCSVLDAGRFRLVRSVADISGEKIVQANDDLQRLAETVSDHRHHGRIESLCTPPRPSLSAAEQPICGAERGLPLAPTVIWVRSCELSLARGIDGPLRAKIVSYESMGGNYQDVKIRVPSTEKAERILGFKAQVKLEAGLESTIAWHRALREERVAA